MKALATPRRGVPIAAVVASLVAVELYYGDVLTALVPLGMSIGFVLLAPWSWQRQLAKHTTLAGALLYVAGAAAVVATFGIALPRALDLGPTFLTDPGSLAIAGVLYCVGGWGLGRDIELEHDLEHVRLKAIRAHLDPHFLYNTLNAIAEWCAEDPRVAEAATIRLADLLRAMLEGLERRAWSLAREVALVEDFLELHRLRDPEAFTSRVEVEVDADAAARADVPPLVLLSIVENAVKHGPRAGHRGEIAVRISSTGDRIACAVTNPGTFAPTGSTGRGLAMLAAHAMLADARFSIASDGDHTRAVLELRCG